MHNTEGNRIAYMLAMATGLSGLAAQALLRAWGFEGPGDIVLACTVVYTLFVHALACTSPKTRVWYKKP